MELNPESLMLRQSDGMWQKYMALVLWKLQKRQAVNITEQDLRDFEWASRQHGIVVMTHGHSDSITFQLLTNEEAEKKAKEERLKDEQAPRS